MTQQLDGILAIRVMIVIKETGSLKYLVIHSVYMQGNQLFAYASLLVLYF